MKAESLKERYSDLSYAYEFVPVAVESSGVFGPCSLAFMKELGNHSREEKAATNLIQRLCFAV